MSKSLVVAVDRSARSAGLVRFAAALAPRLYPVHVVEPRRTSMNYAIAFPSRRDAERALGRRARAELRAPAEDAHGRVVIARGEPARSIVGAAERLGAEAVVVDGSHHAFLRHLARGHWRCLLGRLAALSPVPLIVAKPSQKPPARRAAEVRVLEAGDASRRRP